MRFSMLEVALSLGVRHDHHETKHVPENPWRELHNGLWDDTVVMLKN